MSPPLFYFYTRKKWVYYLLFHKTIVYLHPISHLCVEQFRCGEGSGSLNVKKNEKFIAKNFVDKFFMHTFAIRNG